MKNIILILLLAATAGMAQAQTPKERIEALKISYITRALHLTPEEAQAFWPLYNEYQDKLEVLKKERRAATFERWKKDRDLSDAEIEEALDQYLAYNRKELDLQEEYIEKFKTVLPVKKVAQLIVAEERFKLVLLEELKKRRQMDRRPSR